MTRKLRNRTAAGYELAAQLAEYTDLADGLVLALPRGGVPVAYEIARLLHLPLDICLVRKLGVPGNLELAMGAIGGGGSIVLNEELIETRQISQETIALAIAREQIELERRERLYRSVPAISVPYSICDRTLILVDDGIATGSTFLAAISTLIPQRPAAIVAAAPVLPRNLYQQLSTQLDRVEYLMTPEPFYCIGMWYEDFSQTSDEEVCRLLAAAATWGKSS
jgi:putative phosphoribosyl transferase